MEEEDIVTRQDGSMLVEASMNVDDFMEEMGILSYDDLKEEDFTTLSGLAMFLIGRVPKQETCSATRTYSLKLWTWIVDEWINCSLSKKKRKNSVNLHYILT